MSKLISFVLVFVAFVALTTPVSANACQLPAVYPLVNILLPLLNNVYNLLLSLLSIFDTLPPAISAVIPVDLGALETSLLKLYSQALAIVNFLRYNNTNDVYCYLFRSLLSIFDILPPAIGAVIPVDLGALETSLLKLYSQALAIVNFLRSLPEYAAGANPKSSCNSVSNLQGLLSSLITAITELAEDLLIGIGGGLLPALLKLVLCVVQALLNLLI